ncbi:hypothetical protein B9Z19DRAFT_1126047 [Tuber borchii]|uniref:Uncharacterized protein n=1 Tax=Tuber borchii TaxID=42251 RepID=A0A2T6ZTI9_TUBBO|nr:hypothetical protein B9Z19DRAFT_1126047 [Tuber borchii]
MLHARDDLVNIYSVVIVEARLGGDEGTMTLVPDGQGNFMALPIVQRFDQVSGEMPWSGHVSVTKNSWVLSAREEDSCHLAAKNEYQKAADLLKLTSRCDDQDSLWAMAAKGFGLYPTFVRKCIETARHLLEARTIEALGTVVRSLDNFTVWEKWSGNGKDGSLGIAM